MSRVKVVQVESILGPCWCWSCAGCEFRSTLTHRMAIDTATAHVRAHESATGVETSTDTSDAREARRSAYSDSAWQESRL